MSDFTQNIFNYSTNQPMPIKTVFRLFIPIIIVLYSCSSADKPERSSFIWENDYFNNYLSDEDQTRLDSLGITHFYVKYADVQWNLFYEMAEPVYHDDKYGSFNLINITPVIFITNDVLLFSSPADIKPLAEKIHNLYCYIHQKNAEKLMQSFYKNKYDRWTDESSDNFDNWTRYYEAVEDDPDSIVSKWTADNNELLIDCDWTVSTKEKYFSLLKELQKLDAKIEIQSTLRLWQYRDHELAGVPPVDRCLLMCYSTGNPADPDEENAIVDLKTIKEYINHSGYPKELDIALPVYSWAVLFRNKEFRGIISPVTLTELKEMSFLEQLKDTTRFLVKTDTVIGDLYYRYGDELRFQGVNTKELTDIATWVDKKINPGKNARVSLFSYDTLYFNQIGNENIDKIFHIFE